MTTSAMRHMRNVNREIICFIFHHYKTCVQNINSSKSILLRVRNDRVIL